MYDGIPEGLVLLDWAVEGIDAHREGEGVRGDVIGPPTQFFH